MFLVHFRFSLVFTLFLVEGGMTSSITKLLGFIECGHKRKRTQWRIFVFVTLFQTFIFYTFTPTSLQEHPPNLFLYHISHTHSINHSLYSLLSLSFHPYPSNPSLPTSHYKKKEKQWRLLSVKKEERWRFSKASSSGLSLYILANNDAFKKRHL